MVKVKLPIPPRKPYLPKDDPDPKARAACLETMRSEYVIYRNAVLQLPMLEKVPTREQFSSRYEFGRGAATLPMVANEAAASPSGAQAFVPFDGLAHYDAMYPVLPDPQVIPVWMEDSSFGEQRLSGLNPGMIQKASNEGDLPNVDIAALKAALPGTVPWPLYVVDYSDKLSGIKGGRISIPGTPFVGDQAIQKYCPKPIGIFVWDDSESGDGARGEKNGRFRPLAIQIDTGEKGASKTFTPTSPKLVWTAAKAAFGIADANFHEMSTHLGRCHFALEAFGAVTPRQLAAQHPLYILLEPHLKFLVVNNQAGIDQLVQPDGPVDTLLAGTREESLEIARKAAKEWSITETFPEELARRGVEWSEDLPHYPYRDDGQLIWDATRKYVKNYLDLYYKSDAVVAADSELKEWAKELADPGKTGGNVGKMPKEITTKDQLVNLVTKIIFSLSTEHSSINFSQFPYLGFSPNAPLAGFADYREFFDNYPDSSEEQLAFLLKFLPRPFAALGQIAITFALSAYHYDALGDYGNSLVDTAAKQCVYDFRQDLNNIERRIELCNRRRLEPYTFMLPSNVLNGASI